MNPATRYQTIDGFGAATWIWGSNTWSTAETQTLVGMGPNQFGLSIIRTGISPVSSEWSTHVNALRTAKSYGSDVKILASPWTAPAEWKTNNSRTNGGKLRTEYYDDYANHLNSFVQYMRNQGVTVDVTSVQNEPDWHPDYDSMDWNGTELRDFVRDHGTRVQNTKLMLPETVHLKTSYADPTLNDATARNNIGYIGTHLYSPEDAGALSPYPLAAQYNKPVWMTEWNHHEADGSGSNVWGNPATRRSGTRRSTTSCARCTGGWRPTGAPTSGGTASASTRSSVTASRRTAPPRALRSSAGTPSPSIRSTSAPATSGSPLTKSSKASPLEVTAYTGDGKITLVILNRSTSAVNNAVIQVSARSISTVVLTL